VTLTSAGEIAEIVFAGGAGHGDPRERDRSAVESDLLDGRISRDAARALYALPTTAAAE
jgi:N-methylhydantoinase B/oxoprolinase/acetone carboxylase alpha subunit